MRKFYVNYPLQPGAKTCLPTRDALLQSKQYETAEEAFNDVRLSPFNTSVQCGMIAEVIAPEGEAYRKEDIHRLWIVQQTYDKNSQKINMIPLYGPNGRDLNHTLGVQVTDYRPFIRPAGVALQIDTHTIMYGIVASESTPFDAPIYLDGMAALTPLHAKTQESGIMVLDPGNALHQAIQDAFMNKSPHDERIGIVYKYAIPNDVHIENQTLSPAEAAAFCVGAISVNSRGGHLNIHDIQSSEKRWFQPDFHAHTSDHSVLLTDLDKKRIKDGQLFSTLLKVDEILRHTEESLAGHPQMFNAMWNLALSQPTITQEQIEVLKRVMDATPHPMQVVPNILEALKQQKCGHHHVETSMLCTVAEKLLYNQEPRFMPANDQLVSKVISDTMESSHTQDALDDIDMDEK